MTESVEQAALRRAAHDDLPAPFGAIMQAIAAAGDLCDARHRQTAMLVEQVDALHAENAELRDGLLALSNRIEAVTRREGPSIPVSACGNPATHPAHRYLSYSDAGSAVYEVTAVQCPGVE